MSFAKKHNGEKKFTANLNTEGFEGKKLSALYGENGKDFIYPIHAISKHTFEDDSVGYAVLTDNEWAYMPTYMCATMEEMLNDEEDIATINAGRAGFKIGTYKSRNPKSKGKLCYSVEFVDIKPTTANEADEIPFK